MDTNNLPVGGQPADKQHEVIARRIAGCERFDVSEFGPITRLYFELDTYLIGARLHISHINPALRRMATSLNLPETPATWAAAPWSRAADWLEYAYEGEEPDDPPQLETCVPHAPLRELIDAAIAGIRRDEEDGIGPEGRPLDIPREPDLPLTAAERETLRAKIDTARAADTVLAKLWTDASSPPSDADITEPPSESAGVAMRALGDYLEDHVGLTNSQINASLRIRWNLPEPQAKPGGNPTEKPPVPSYVRKHGTLRPILANAVEMLRTAHEWKGVVGFNEFTLQVQMLKSAPWVGATPKPSTNWNDHDDRQTAIWLQQNECQVTDEVASKAVEVIAMDHQFHPVRRYLDNLSWDGRKRTNTWTTRYLGSPANAYTEGVGERTLTAAVARIYKPGCKADCCTIFEGPQGILKSTALRTLADPWFSDELSELGTKDSCMQMAGIWIIELSELDSMNSADVSKVKSFMSRSTDRFRPPYGRRVIDSPRQCIFIGTSNHDAYLKDETGARRFWPVTCGRIDIEALKHDRDQLWAEAVARYRRGASWWLDTPELNTLARKEQGDRYTADAWDQLIRDWVVHPIPRFVSGDDRLIPFTSSTQSVSLPDVLCHCIGKAVAMWTQADKIRVARSLRSMGYERFRERTGDRLEWRYRPTS